MPADKEEISEGEEEGIVIYPSKTFEKIEGIDKVTGVTFNDIESFSFDENKRLIIVKKEDSKHTIEADTVIFAVGQRPDITEEAGLDIGRGNSIAVNDGSLATNVKGIFAAGDSVYGTNSVIKAIASGRDAAAEIDKYLGGDGNILEELAPKEKVNPFIGKCEGFDYKERVNSQILKVDERIENFKLVNHGICDSEICDETERCLQCDLRLQISSPRLWGDFTSEDKGEK
jgi:NADPH-dependent 2,4-dienoyl-CoA reductase/sulfur reductase-like enzyme